MNEGSAWVLGFSSGILFGQFAQWLRREREETQEDQRKPEKDDSENVGESEDEDTEDEGDSESEDTEEDTEKTDDNGPCWWCGAPPDTNRYLEGVTNTWSDVEERKMAASFVADCPLYPLTPPLSGSPRT